MRGYRCGLNIVSFFRCVTHEWMSSVFEVLFFFLLVSFSVLSSWDEIDVCVELLADDVWAAEYDKTVFLSVEVNSFESIIFVRKTSFLAHGANEYYKTKIWELRIIEKSQQIEIWDFLMNDQNIMFGYTPLWKNSENQKISIN